MKGFTLFEILIVMGISAAIATVGFLSLSGYRGAQDLDLAAQSIVSALREAQLNSASAEGGNTWGVRFLNASRASLTLFATSSASDYLPQSTTTLRSSLELRDPMSGYKDVIFNQVTGFPRGGLTVIIKVGVRASTTAEKTITIYGNGRIDY